jgi:hypothetical protein
MLSDAAEPLQQSDLALLVGTSGRALAGSLRRDNRFVQLRPSGRWSIAEWGVTESVHRSTLEATIAVLTEHGPLALGRLIKEVKAIYPVSDAAVQQCLNHHLIGRWPDRTIDLVERGAPPITRRKPKKTRDVQVQEGVVHLRRLVDHDLLRGSGVGVPGYLTWALGLMVAPSARTFQVGSLGRISVKYAIQGSTISSLRTFADKLGAQEGCRLVISLSLSDDDAASIALACDDHHHTGSLP